ncbi:tRNA pseudouridine(13) synthase TruD [Candidatus Woesearchaeota archaeon]|nr:tRNA pseudouridine(13) synthase TruD [Candidatus Woesearchaeota archaeon]
MYQIKKLPEDFIVKEISNVNIDAKGRYAYFFLKKTNYSTVAALQALSKKLKIPLKNIGFAGNKDKNAITEQKISVFRGKRDFENIKLRNIELSYLGNGNSPISLGDLEGNEFIITIRDLNKEEIKKVKSIQNRKIKIPNLYGPQRFSKNNDLIGKAIIKRDFKKSVGLILESNGSMEAKIKNYLSYNKNNYVEALRLIPLKTRKLFVHSYQSFLFNKIIENYIEDKKSAKNIKIPLIGFSFEVNSVKNMALKDIFKKILNDEKINPRNFIINEIPELTAEGGSRDLFFRVNDLKILETGNDELNENKKKIKVNFTLPKSCYATVALEFVFHPF